MSGQDNESRERLIAAAPDLLAVVRYVAALRLCEEDLKACRGASGPYCETHGDNDLHEEVIAAARAALSKAEGK